MNVNGMACSSNTALCHADKSASVIAEIEFIAAVVKSVWKPADQVDRTSAI
jgi:hypothetical protein